jgi:hypothetical protein
LFERILVNAAPEATGRPAAESATAGITTATAKSAEWLLPGELRAAEGEFTAESCPEANCVNAHPAIYGLLRGIEGERASIAHTVR